MKPIYVIWALFVLSIVTCVAMLARSFVRTDASIDPVAERCTEISTSRDEHGWWNELVRCSAPEQPAGESPSASLDECIERIDVASTRPMVTSRDPREATREVLGVVMTLRSETALSDTARQVRMKVIGGLVRSERTMAAWTALPLIEQTSGCPSDVNVTSFRQQLVRALRHEEDFMLRSALSRCRPSDACTAENVRRGIRRYTAYLARTSLNERWFPTPVPTGLSRLHYTRRAYDELRSIRRGERIATFFKPESAFRRARAAMAAADARCGIGAPNRP